MIIDLEGIRLTEIGSKNTAKARNTYGKVFLAFFYCSFATAQAARSERYLPTTGVPLEVTTIGMPAPDAKAMVRILGTKRPKALISIFPVAIDGTSKISGSPGTTP